MLCSTPNRTKRYNSQRKVLIIYAGVMALAISVLKSYAQQDPQFSQYMFNTETINPAYAGTRGMLNIFSLYRTQWVGLEGAPRVLNFTASMPVTKSLGLGVNFINDEIGPSVENTLAVNFSYGIALSDDLKLALGIKGGINTLDVDFGRLLIHDPTEAEFHQQIDNRITPAVGIGAYLYTSRLYFGMSIPNLLQTKHYDNEALTTATEKLNFYIIGGYVFDLSAILKFKPAFLVKALESAPLSVDLSASLLFYERVSLGLAYRFDAAVSSLAGFQLNDQLMLGYAYDWDTTSLGNYNSGSHELFLRFDLFNSKTRRLTSPRFF